MLVVNADDFGLGQAVNRAVIRCFRERACTSTTIMANMPGFEEACALASEHGIRRNVGLHLVLNEGTPVTEGIRRERIFCTEQGEFCFSREAPVFSLTRGERDALAAEIRGQIRMCRERGLPLSHVDSHHHVHTEWGIASVLIPIALEEKIPFIRIARNLGDSREIAKRVYKFLYNANLGRFRLRGARYFGSAEEYARFQGLHGTAPGVTEIMIHPQYRDSDVYVTDSWDLGEFQRRLRPWRESVPVVSFGDLAPRRSP